MLTSTYLQILTDAIKHSDIDINDTYDLLITHFKQCGIIAQSTTLFTRTHVHNTYTHALTC